jgi:hypothetical protein
MNLKPARVGVSGDGAGNTAPHEFCSTSFASERVPGFSASFQLLVLRRERKYRVRVHTEDFSFIGDCSQLSLADFITNIAESRFRYTQ